jgi:hypothetical protein
VNDNHFRQIHMTKDSIKISGWLFSQVNKNLRLQLRALL